ncbi:MAG: isocitrate lyase [Chloroflexi bacterium]|nr:isocitrate lyase [Chloroflexota bacterium]
MATTKEKRQALHDLLYAPGCTIAPSGFDALSAMVIERAGFKAIHISGSSVHRSFGYPDVGLLTMHDQIARATQIADAVNLPVIGDGETGFGNVVNLVRAVREFERAGVAAIHIEDQETPKRPTHEGAEGSFISKDEFTGKIKAAVDTRADDSFCIIARIDARAVESFDQVVERGMAACEAGADAIWMGLRVDDEMERITKIIPRPMVGVRRRARPGGKTYGEMGYKIGVVPGVLQSAAVWAMASVLKTMLETGDEMDFFGKLSDYDEPKAWLNAVGNAGVRDIETRYLNATTLAPS